MKTILQIREIVQKVDMKKVVPLLCVFILEAPSLFSATSIPVHFFPYTKLPVIEVIIEGKTYSLEIDTGAVGDLVLKQEALDWMELKKEVGTIQTVGINGHVRESQEFLIPNLQIGDLKFSSLIARQEDLALLTEEAMVRPSPEDEGQKRLEKQKKIDGKIGWGIFQNRHVYFDFYHSLLWFCEDLNDLKKNVPYLLEENSVEVPFEMGNTGIVFSINTKAGLQRCMLDTGANLSCLRESLIEKNLAHEFEPGKWMLSSEIEIGGTRLGSYSFFLYNFTPLFQVDGILGIQFFQRNGIYLDFQNKKALIGPPKRSLWSRLVDQIECFWSWLAL